MTRWFNDRAVRPITWNNDFPGLDTTAWVGDDFSGTGGSPPTSWSNDIQWPQTAVWINDVDIDAVTWTMD